VAHVARILFPPIVPGLAHPRLNLKRCTELDVQGKRVRPEQLHVWTIAELLMAGTTAIRVDLGHFVPASMTNA